MVGSSYCYCSASNERQVRVLIFSQRCGGKSVLLGGDVASRGSVVSIFGTEHVAYTFKILLVRNGFGPIDPFSDLWKYRPLLASATSYP